MEFTSYFRLTSYATIAAAALALYVAGGVGLLLLGSFALVMVVSFKLEETRWQLSERIALAVILVSIPFFYLDWQVLTPLVLTGLGDAIDATGVDATQRGEIPRAVSK